MPHIGDQFFLVLDSAGDQCCGSGMFIPEPYFYQSRISDPRYNDSNKRGGGGGGEIFVVLPFPVASNFTKEKHFEPIHWELHISTFYSNNCN